MRDIVKRFGRTRGIMRECAAAVPRRGTKSLLTGAGAAFITWPPKTLFKPGRAALSAPLALVSALRTTARARGAALANPAAGEGEAGRGRAMPRSFLVDSLVLREAGGSDKKGGVSPGSPPPPPLFPYAVHPSHPLHGLSGGACPAAPVATSAARKAGLLCVCPLCVAAASQLHPPPPPPPALPLLKASFPPFGSQYCPSPLAARQSSGGSSASSGGHAPALYQSAYPLPDPRHFHCISVGK